MDCYELVWKRSAERELRKLPREVIAALVLLAEGLVCDPYPPGARWRPAYLAGALRRLPPDLHRRGRPAGRAGHPRRSSARGVSLNLCRPGLAPERR